MLQIISVVSTLPPDTAVEIIRLPLGEITFGVLFGSLQIPVSSM